MMTEQGFMVAVFVMVAFTIALLAFLGVAAYRDRRDPRVEKAVSAIYHEALKILEQHRPLPRH